MAYTVETRGAADDVLHDLVQAGLPRLLATLAAEDRYLPPFVVQELEDYLRCGDVACGFGWLACDDCPHHRLVAFSCKGRGFCPSCMSRRMEERSERWVTALFPFRRVRQWVLTVPWPRRWLFARHHQLARGVLRVAMAVIQAFYADRTAGGRTGTVTVVQRWGSALPLNIHFHILAVDGTFERQDDDTVLWRASPPPTTDEIERLVEDIARRAEAWLAKKGFGPNDEDFEENETDALLHAAAVAGHSAFQRRRSQQIAGREIRLPPLCAAYQGYTVHAGVSIPAHDRAGLRRLCRYILRPPIARDRLERRTDGRVALNLKRPQANGATEVVFTPEELVERLAAGIPRPGTNQVLYHGVFAPQSKLRRDVVPKPPRRPRVRRLVKTPTKPSRWVPWGELLRRVFETDGFACPRCGARMRLHAVVIDGAVAKKILNDLARGGAGPP